MADTTWFTKKMFDELDSLCSSTYEYTILLRACTVVHLRTLHIFISLGSAQETAREENRSSHLNPSPISLFSLLAEFHAAAP